MSRKRIESSKRSVCTFKLDKLGLAINLEIRTNCGQKIDCTFGTDEKISVVGLLQQVKSKRCK